VAYQSANVIVCSRCLQGAWQWIASAASLRPRAPCGPCIYDEKQWSSSEVSGVLQASPRVLSVVTRLYLASQLGDHQRILEMAHGGAAPSVVVWGGTIDADVKVVIARQSRFRYSLSESLAFWTRLAAAQGEPQSSTWGRTRPNLQPDDKGPDGLFASIADEIELEVEEVKSSLTSPRSRMASQAFRVTGRVKEPARGAKTGRALEDFWLLEQGIVGFRRLDDLASDLWATLGVSSDQALRAGLISRCTYNATAVANDRHSGAEVFAGYEHVTAEVERRVGTYIGVVDWGVFAKEVREQVRQTLVSAGVW
jgi:hypothetical protein